MLRIFIATSAFLAATSALALSLERQEDFVWQAGRAVSVADACLALGVPIQPVVMIEEIDAAMHRLGAKDEAIEEWRSKIVAEQSPDIQLMLLKQTRAARNDYCVHFVVSSRKKLKALLSGGFLDKATK